MNRVLIPLSPAAGQAPPPHAPGARLCRWQGEAMGTTWSVLAALPARAGTGVADGAQGMDAVEGLAGVESTDAVQAAIDGVLAGVVAQMSNWRGDSDIGRYNRAAPGTWLTLPADAAAVVACALQVARDSGGAYDPSAGPLVDLWGFGPAPRRSTPPAPAEVELARARCGWQRVGFDAAERRLQQPGGLSLDLCAIAKGFAVDAVSRRLAALGLPHHLVEIGGELRGAGTKPDGTPWWVELETPAADTGGARTLVALYGLAVATSGDYRRYFDCGGRRYAHTLDPRTGYPASHALASVTVLHAECMLADALSTALTVLGPEAGLAFARGRQLAARFLLRTPHGFEERLSPAFEAMLS
ncbi:thiamine biosynthesis protein ApbE [Cupriavidus sp. USMAA2-4]|uniref:FAD:protein FMN transferase n=1 Tax=Cupriavidus sp. USMAA2-4 TaxID=876364 RepID=UPI0008A6EC3A|nr:FAD:protein FMN transferase [Cupriavidus sp. USMAA2-4]AOY94974.1 thiamine biosynthesis protein ApbE [Cupriavidus sp. USMAA2-4]